MPRASTILVLALVSAPMALILPAFVPPAPRVHAAEDTSAGSRLPVIASPVRRVAGYEVRGQYVGRVVGRRTSELGFDTPGLLEAVLVREGDRVRKGDVLARLNITRLKARRQQLTAQLALARATYKESEANLELAKVTAHRQKNLMRSENVSRQAYDEARFQEQALRATLDANRASIEQAAAAVASLDADIELSQIVAPFDGTITGRLVDEGVALVSATPVLRLVEDEAMEVRIGLPSAVADRLEPGRLYDISIAGDERRGRLRALLHALDPMTRTVPAIFDVEARSSVRPPRSGQLAVILVNRFVADAGYWVPLGALVGGRRGLWDATALIREEGEPPLYRTVRREVEVLQTETERVFVRGAIADGDLIVTDGLHRIVPGQIVRLAEPRP